MSDDERVTKPFKFVTGTLGPRPIRKFPRQRRHTKTWPDLTLLLPIVPEYTVSG